MKQSVKRVGTFAWVGVVVTIIDYAILELIVLLIFKNSKDTSIASAIAGIFSTIVSFFMHSRITWKDREITKFNIVKFFIWNIAVFVMLRPLLVWGVTSLTVINDFVFSITSWIGLGKDLIISTWSYGVVTLITMTLNFLFYDKIVFSKKN